MASMQQALLSEGHLSQDPYWSSVVLLAHFNGTNGSTTIVDSSNSNRSISCTGNAQISTAQYRSGSSSAGYFDGSGDYMTVVDTPDIVLSGDFTIEGFVKCPEAATTQSLITLGGVDWQLAKATNSGGFNGRVSLWDGTSTRMLTAVGTIGNDLWWYWGWTRSGSLHTIWSGQDGSSIGSVMTTSWSGSGNSINPTSIILGSYSGGAEYLNGYLAEVRITNGVCRYSSSFGPILGQFPNA
jgi:hypothetical protein